MDGAAVWLDIAGGLLIAGALAAWVPHTFWQSFFLTSHPILGTLWGPIVGPLVAVISFVLLGREYSTRCGPLESRHQLRRGHRVHLRRFDRHPGPEHLSKVLRIQDGRLPGFSGLDLQTGLADAGIRIPVVFMTAYGDIPMSVRAMKAGAIDFLTKPFRDQEILDAVALALDRDRKRRNEEKAVANLKALFESLTRRERQVMALITDGLMNKQVAGKIGIGGHGQDPPWQPHEEMRAKSLAELVRMAEVLGVRGEASSGVKTYV